MEVLTVYTMKTLGVGGVVGIGEGIFHAPNSDFFASAGHFDPPSSLSRVNRSRL